jgi:anti-anti-sigma factor
MKRSGCVDVDEVIMSVSEHLSIHRSHEDGVERLVPVGELDLATAPILERAFDLAFDDGDVRMIVVDLAELSFMDSSGLHLLLRMTEACRAGDRLRVVNGSPAVVRLLDVSGTSDLLPLVPSEGDPLAPLPPIASWRGDRR